MKPPPTPVEHVNAKIKNCGVTPISEDHDEMWGVPTLTELGFDTSNLPPPKWQGKSFILRVTLISNQYLSIF